MAAWLQKALREAKQETSWDNPNAAFEAACAGFLAKILNPSISGEFLAAIEAFVGRIAPAGIVNSLSQTLLRLTTPGIPDLYQGTEFWDFSLVDPDNRGAVDFAAHAEALAAPAPIETLMNNWRDGRIKQALIARVLRFRKRREQLFATGDYAPVPVSGPLSAHLVALLRRQGDEAALVLASRHCAEFLGVGDPPLVPPDRWRDTVLHLPVDWTGASIHDVLNDRALEKTADIASFLGPLPVALCHLRTSTVDR
jgi:maltooligosyltrehalose synthase